MLTIEHLIENEQKLQTFFFIRTMQKQNSFIHDILLTGKHAKSTNALNAN